MSTCPTLIHLHPHQYLYLQIHIDWQPHRSQAHAYVDRPSTRISLALFHGENGIGLSLLEDFAGSGGDPMIGME